MSGIFKSVVAGLVTVAMLTACADSEPYSPEDEVEVEEVRDVEADEALNSDDVLNVEAPAPVEPSPRIVAAMRAAEAAYRASAAYNVPGATDPSAPPVITATEFGRLKSGMTYEAATNIIGTPGKLVEEMVSPAGAVNMIYRWVNGDGSYADATFTNQVLSSKTQQRLP